MTRTARFYLMYAIVYIVADTVHIYEWLFEHLRRATVTAYRITGEAWWAGEMRANLNHPSSAEETK